MGMVCAFIPQRMRAYLSHKVREAGKKLDDILITNDLFVHRVNQEKTKTAKLYLETKNGNLEYPFEYQQDSNASRQGVLQEIKRQSRIPYAKDKVTRGWHQY